MENQSMLSTQAMFDPGLVPGAASGPDDGLEVQGAEATEIVAAWKGSVLEVRHYPLVKGSKSYTLGEDPRSDLPIDAALLGGRDFFSLVDVGSESSRVHLVEGMTGEVTLRDGTRNALEAFADGASSFELPTGARARLDLGDFSFLVGSVLPGRLAVAAPQADWTAMGYTALSFLVHATFLLMVYLVPPDPTSLSISAMEESNRFARYLISPPELQQSDTEDWIAQQADEQQGGSGMRHADTEGAMGDREAPETGRRFGIEGPPDNPDPHMARDRARDMAAQSGILAVLQSAAPTSRFGGESALGNDPESALGALMGSEIGRSFGYGGLGRAGTGRGGGGDGEGTIGLGRLRTIGHGGGGGRGQGYGRGNGDLRGGHRMTGPTVRPGSASVSGSLSRDVIRRYLRRHIPQIRHCYERELARRPDLGGRVQVRFVISGSGAVATSTVASSSMGSPAVEQCVARAVQRIAFPAPDGGGVVIVTYPFMFQAAD